MEEQNTVVQETKRPVFLTVISIISFVMLGWFIIGSMGEIIKLFTYGFDFMMLISIFVGIATTVLAFFGVLMMWKLKKSGFILFVIANGIYLLTSIINTIYYQMLYFDIGFLIKDLFSFHNIYAIALVIMFGLNLKHMK